LGLPASRPASCPDAGSAFARLADALDGASFAGRGIIGRMRAAASGPRFATGLRRPPVRPALLADPARTRLALYRQDGAFPVLPRVTASHAARVLCEHLPRLASETALTALWGAACAAYASVGAPRLTEPPAGCEAPPWKEIFAGAVAKDDDHVIKMTYTCHCE